MARHEAIVFCEHAGDTWKLVRLSNGVFSCPNCVRQHLQALEVKKEETISEILRLQGEEF